jgi:hypothetical protein
MGPQAQSFSSADNMALNKQLVSRLQFLCQKAYVNFKFLVRTEESWLHGFKALIFKQYHSGNSIAKYLQGGHELAVIQAGKDGPLYVVTTLESFLEIAQQAEQHVPSELPCQQS